MPEDGKPDRMRAEFAEAEVMSVLYRAIGPRMDSLPEGELRRDLQTLMTKHGNVIGLALARPPRGTLLDAKIELDARINDLGITAWETGLSDRVYRALAQGVSLTQEQIKVVAGQTVGRQIHIADVTFESKMRGQFAWGALCGALAESWRY